MGIVEFHTYGSYDTFTTNEGSVNGAGETFIVGWAGASQASAVTRDDTFLVIVELGSWRATGARLRAGIVASGTTSVTRGTSTGGSQVKS